MTAGDLRLDLTLVNAADEILADAAHTWTAENVEFMLEYTDIAKP